jgi:peptide/nickel transport system substrate-binding protein
VKEDPGNWSFYIPGQFPDGVVSATASSKYTVVLTLSKGYNSSFFTDSLLTDLIPLPSTAWNRSTAGGPGVDYSKPANARAIFDFLNGQSKKQQTFASSSLWQVVDGPFRLKSFNPATGGYTLVPNAKYSGPNPAKISELSFESFTSSAAEFNQLRSGTLTVGDLDLTQLPEISTLSAVGYNVYGLPPAGALDPLFLNFQDTTDNFDKVIAQLYVRQALQHLINQPGLIKSKGVYNGAAAEQYTTVGANSPYAPSFGSKAPYPYDPKTATKLLTDHGWEVVPSGKTTCLRPGATATECGVGIPKGQDISFALISANSPSAVSAQDLAFVSAARALGVRIDVQSKTPSYMYQNYSNVSAPANKNKWGMGDVGQITLGGLYPTAATLFSQQAVLNVGTYNSAAATKLFDETVYGSNPRALSAESTFVGENLPSLFMPNADIVRVWKKSLSGTQDSFSSLTQSDYGDVYTPEFWYYTK